MVMLHVITELFSTISKAANDSVGMEELLLRVRQEEQRRAQWRKENIRRRHNYLPFIVELLKGLAQEGQLVKVYEAAKEKAAKREQKKNEKAGTAK